jgi:hypothetical protein
VKDLAVVMCAWMRPENFQATLDGLAHQTDRGFRFFVWNNNPRLADGLEACASDRQSFCLAHPVEFQHSPHNVGEIGLLYYGRILRDRGFRYVITIDDDEILGDQMVAAFRREAAPRSISSFWAWRIHPDGNYYDRVRASPGAPAHYCGFGGTVFDSDLFLSDALLYPEGEVWYRDGRVVLTDLLVSVFARLVLGWRLRGSAARLTIQPDGKDQSIELGERKNAALSHLRENGWRI